MLMVRDKKKANSIYKKVIRINPKEDESNQQS